MGNLSSKGKYDLEVVVLGMENAGKSCRLNTILDLTNKLINKNNDTPTEPTFSFRDLECTIKGKGDCGGSERLRDLWSHYYENLTCLIYVVDSTDKSKLEKSGELFTNACVQIGMKNTSVLIVCNKADLPNAMKPAEITELMDIKGVKQQWKTVVASAKTNQGVDEINSWIKASMKAKTK